MTIVFCKCAVNFYSLIKNNGCTIKCFHGCYNSLVGNFNANKEYLS